MGFLDPRLPFVFIAFLGVGLALRSLAKAASNLSFSTFIFSPCYDYWRVRQDSDLRNVREHVLRDYKSGALNHSATDPLLGLIKFRGHRKAAPNVACTTITTHAAFLGQENTQRRASCLFLNSGSRVECAPRALSIIFSCIPRLTFLSRKSLRFFPKLSQLRLETERFGYGGFPSVRRPNVRNMIAMQSLFSGKPLKSSVQVCHAVAVGTEVKPPVQEPLKNLFRWKIVCLVFGNNFDDRFIQSQRVNVNWRFVGPLLREWREILNYFFEIANVFVKLCIHGGAFLFHTPQVRTEGFKLLFVSVSAHGNG
jgi:hypothetical protein